LVKIHPKIIGYGLTPMTTAAAEERDEEQRRGHTHGRNLERKRAKIKRKRKEKKRKEKPQLGLEPCHELNFTLLARKKRAK
jgi:hypothetical protein